MQIQLVPARAADLENPTSAITRGLEGGFSDTPQAAREAVQAVLDTITRQDRPDPWGAYWALDADFGGAVGLCAFKTEPDGAGAVEIAYYSLPGLEGRGVATAMAGALIQAARLGGARAVTANTLPVANASGVVLRRNGFRWLGPAHDAEDGEVWAWRLEV
ncbi:MAG: GNAT family N-acetyltransferase [Phenylobacterium sp.]